MFFCIKQHIVLKIVLFAELAMDVRQLNKARNMASFRKLHI